MLQLFNLSLPHRAVTVVSFVKKELKSNRAYFLSDCRSSMCLCLQPHMLWFEVNIWTPGVSQPAGVMVFYLLFCLLFFTGPLHLIVIWACLPSTVSPQTWQLLGLCLSSGETGVTHGAHPQLLRWVNMSDHHLALGARRTHHKATFPAVVSTQGYGELVGAAHADSWVLVRDPGNSEGRPGSAVTSLQQSGPAVLHVFNPGCLLLVWGGCHTERLLWCANQPLVPHSHTVMQVLQLDVLWNEGNRGKDTDHSWSWLLNDIMALWKHLHWRWQSFFISVGVEPACLTSPLPFTCFCFLSHCFSLLFMVMFDFFCLSLRLSLTVKAFKNHTLLTKIELLTLISLIRVILLWLDQG